MPEDIAVWKRQEAALDAILQSREEAKARLAEEEMKKAAAEGLAVARRKALAGNKDKITVPGRDESDESDGDSDDHSDGSESENGSLKCTTGRPFTVAEKIEILDYYRGEGIDLFVCYSYSCMQLIS